MAKLLMVIGLTLLVIGLVWHIFPNVFSWFGKLPGDIRHEGENTTLYFPIVTMIVVSVALSIILNLLNR